MMKQKLLTLVLSILLWSQSSKAELTVRFADESSKDNANVRSEIQNTASHFWFAEEQFWKLAPKAQELEIDFSLVSTNHLAQTRAHRINFNTYLPTEDLQSTLKHEVSHVFFGRYCPKIVDPFINELFAYWRSGDYMRLLYGQKQIYFKSEAIKELKTKSAFGNTKSIATARLINELTKKGNENILKDWFHNLLRTCESTSVIETQSKMVVDFLDSIQGIKSTPLLAEETGFLLFDSQANETIVAEGGWHKKQPVGSTLKPLLVPFFADIKKEKKKTKTVEWECGENAPQNWNYQSALNYSCNGFFLETKIAAKEMDSYVRILNGLTHSSYNSKWLNMADLIGLWPSIQLNLLDIAKIYDYVLEQNPDTVSVLKKTAQQGTLSSMPDSRWFLDNGIALKSGTTTGMDLAVETGYIVAMFNINSAPKIAVIYKSGQRPVDLLPELKNKISKYLDFKDSKAQVQVLSSFNLNSVNISCPTILMKDGKVSETNVVDLKARSFGNARISCVGAPFEVTADDKMPRRLYGDLSFRKLQPIAKVDAARSEKNARARKGSELILHTSEWHYLRSVFFSESGDHRQELKKAILLVIKNNLGFWKNKNLPICDTTICQVFNLNYEQVTEAQKKSVNEIILSLGPVQLDSKRWLEFSLGGLEPWSQKIGVADLNEFARVSGIVDWQGSRVGKEFKISFNETEQVFSCEKIRSYFRLKSCPDALQLSDANELVFIGRGEGHERGMDLTQANQLAIQGYSFDQILENYYEIKLKSQSK
jgi:hypothetical protein